MLNKLFIIFLFCFSFTEVAKSADLKKIVESEAGKVINVKSKSLVVRNNDDLAIFYDDVVVTQGSLTLKANEIVVITELMEGGRKRFKIIKAKDKVTFKVQGKEAKADKARYVIDDKVVVLEGNVSLEEEGNTVKGDKFTYNVASGKTSIKSLNKDGSEAKKTRVRATIIPDEDVSDIDIPIPPVKILKGEKGGKSNRGKN